MMKKLINLIFCFITVGLNAQTVNYNEQFRVSTSTTGIQQDISVSKLSNGGFVVCWASLWQEDKPCGIYSQLFNDDGSKKGTEFKIADEDVAQIAPCIGGLLDSGFVVCWTTSSGVFGQIFENSGYKRTFEFQVNATNYGFQYRPEICGLSDGGFLVCWVNEDENSRKIYAQLFNNDGSKRGTEFLLGNNDNNLYDDYPNICGLSENRFLICWFCYDQETDNINVKAQVFNGSGLKLGSEIIIEINESDIFIQPKCCAYESGFVICWNDYAHEGRNIEIFIQLFDSDGNKIGSKSQITENINYYHTRPDVCSLKDGGFTLCWRSGSFIFGQLFSGNGKKYGYEFQANIGEQNIVDKPRISSFSNGKFVLCWENFGDTPGIYGKYYLDSLIHPLQKFSLLEPATDTTIKSTNQAFNWHKASNLHINFPWELEYKFYIDEFENFVDPIIIPNIYDTTYTINALTPGTTYFWKILAKNISGDSLWSSETNAFFVDWNATAIEETPINQLKEFELCQNYPNPFNPETIIKYILPVGKAVYNVKVAVYNTLGQQVAILKNEQQSPGEYSVKWDAENFPSGVYFYRIKASNFTEIKKLILLK